MTRIPGRSGSTAGLRGACPDRSRRGREDLIRQVLTGLLGIILLDDLLALSVECIHRGKDADLHKKQYRDAGGQTPYAVPVSAAPFQQLGLGQARSKLLSLRLGLETMLEHANRLRVRTHQKIKPVRLRFNDRERKVDFAPGGKSLPASRTARDMSFYPVRLRPKTTAHRCV